MCELLGMSANVPTDICFSFTGLVQRGGRTGPHKDGWGITFYEGNGCRTFMIRSRASTRRSPAWCRTTRSSPVRWCPIFARPTAAKWRWKTPTRSPANCGPQLTYAHNGQLKGYRQLDTGTFRPVGQTDSEYAFCWLLHQLALKYPRTPSQWPAVFRYIGLLASQLRKKGVFNMLLSDGRFVMAYCSTNLYWITRRAPFGKATLLDQDVEIDFQQQTTPNDVVTVIATQPLTANETWHKIEPGEFALFHFGERLVLSEGVGVGRRAG